MRTALPILFGAILPLVLAGCDSTDPVRLASASLDKLLVTVGLSDPLASIPLDEQLLIAAREGDMEWARTAADQGADPNAALDGVTPLMMAVRGNHPEMAGWLLQSGARVDEAGPDGWTPLLEAVFLKHHGMTELLLDNGASPNPSPDQVYAPALFEAANRNEVTVERYIVPEELLHAARQGNSDRVRLLLDQGANVNVTSPAGWNALMYASEGGHLSTVRLLLERDIKLGQKSDDQLTALHIAVANAHERVVKELLAQSELRSLVQKEAPGHLRQPAALRLLSVVWR